MFLLGSNGFDFPFILFLIFAFMVAIQLSFYWIIFSRFAFFKKKKITPSSLPVSVVICAKNEYNNLKKNLPVVLHQNHPNFEVIVVNDVSDDETIFLLEDLEREYDHLKVVNLNQELNFFSGKKFPLSIGIKSAQYEHLLLTDADCEPASPDWISEMVSGFESGKEVVLGYGKYNEIKGLLNKIIRYETAFTAIQYFSYSLVGLPYMGVGRNLAYARPLFIRSGGFVSHYNVPSGDDDLFINKVATRHNTCVVVSSQSFTNSDGEEKFSSWWRQKRRHLSTGKYYKFKHKLLLGTYSFSLFVLFLLLVLLLQFPNYVIAVTGLFLFRLFSQLIVLKKSFSRLFEKKLLLISPLVELLLLVIYPVIVIANLIFKENKWK